MPAWRVQNSSQVKPRSSSMWESRTCLRHWARAAEQPLETLAKAFWRPTQEPRSNWFCESMRAFRKRVSGFCERFVASRGVGGADPEMHSRNRVGGPATRDLLLDLIVARGCKKDGSARGGGERVGVCFVGEKIF